MFNSGLVACSATMKPTSGIRFQKPPLPESCALRHATANDGRTNPKKAIAERFSLRETPSDKIRANNCHHQYSLRDALPLKFA